MKLINFCLVLVILYNVNHMSNGENLNCEFKDWTFYTCEVTSLDNTNNSMVITGYSRSLNYYKTDTVVKRIWIKDTNTKYIPRNIGLLFNLSHLVMHNTQLIELKSQNFIGMLDLEELFLPWNRLTSVPVDVFSTLKKLKLINLSWNQLEEIENGVFANNLALETVHLFNNKIKFIGTSLFDGLLKLNFVELRGNLCINKEYKVSTDVIQLKIDIKNQCKNPCENHVTTAQNQLNEIKNKLSTAKEQQNKDQMTMDQLLKENEDLLNAKSTHIKDRVEFEEKNFELMNNLTLLNQLNTKLEQNYAEINKSLSSTLNFQQLQQLEIRKLEQESYGLNKEILEARELRQSDRITIIETKKELLNLNEECQKDKLEMNKVKAELLKANEKLALYESTILN